MTHCFFCQSEGVVLTWSRSWAIEIIPVMSLPKNADFGTSPRWLKMPTSVLRPAGYALKRGL